MIKWLKQYWMPTSVSFWLGIFLIASGVIINAFSLLGIVNSPIIEVINFIWQSIPVSTTGLTVSGDGGAITPNALVVAGIALISMRKSQSKR